MLSALHNIKHLKFVSKQNIQKEIMCGGGCITSQSQGGIQTVMKVCGAAGPAGGNGSREPWTPKQTQTHTSDRKNWAKQKLTDEGSEKP